MFQEAFSYTEMLSILQDMEESAKCCVCLEILQPPVQICKNGHAICSACKTTLVECPTCKVRFSKMIPVALNNILETLPKLCKNSGRGCSRLILMRSKNEHESVCPMRIEPCLLGECTWRGSISNLLSHIKIEHDDQCIFLEKNNCFWANPVLNENTLDVTIAQAFGCLFWKYERISTERNKFFIFVRCLPIGDNFPNNFYSKISFHKNNFPISYSYCQKCVSHSVDIDEIFEKENCMAIPLDMLSMLIDKEGKLNYNFTIIRLE